VVLGGNLLATEPKSDEFKLLKLSKSFENDKVLLTLPFCVFSFDEGNRDSSWVMHSTNNLGRYVVGMRCWKLRPR
jgi:hypothetical protein